MTEPSLLCDIGANGVARLTLNRPEVKNAFDAALIGALTERVAALSRDEAVRVIVITGSEQTFCAGADLHMMKAVASFSEAENMAEARRLADMLRTIYEAPKPIVARVNGAAIGGGAGLVAASHIAVGADTAVFAFSEVRLGLIPAAISPFVLQAIGSRAASRLFVTAERFGADAAVAAGLLHMAVPGAELDAAVDGVVSNLLKCGPAAQTEARRLVRDFGGAPVSEAMLEDAAGRIAKIRATAEGREGMTAFLEKRKPNWA
ncbi:MAG: enoyl-CoA hydratase-related protein [Pseudomonadota bacterium]